MTPDDLLNLYSEAFKSIVNSDIREELDVETADSLRNPLVVRKWFDTLVGIKRSIETQLATFKIEKAQRYSDFLSGKDQGYHSWLENKNKWRLGTLRFKASVEEKIAEARLQLRKEVTEADLLRLAIVQHQERVLANPDFSEQYDEELWATALK